MTASWLDASEASWLGIQLSSWLSILTGSPRSANTGSFLFVVYQYPRLDLDPSKRQSTDPSIPGGNENHIVKVAAAGMPFLDSVHGSSIAPFPDAPPDATGAP